MGKGTRRQELRRKRHRRKKAVKLREKMKLMGNTSEQQKA